MHLRRNRIASPVLSVTCSPCITLLVLAGLSIGVPSAFAQFKSGSDGSDGAYAPTASGNFDPTKFHGTGVDNNVFNFTKVTIPAGVTITLTASLDNAPVYWLATGNVDIEGTLNLNGAPGADGMSTFDADKRVPAVAGSGGYGGGVGGITGTNQPATAGSGPGGGAAANDPSTCYSGGYGGTFTGSNQYLIPLVGGSGGGGCLYAAPSVGDGGGAGGGAILVASSTQINIGSSGAITANGGAAGGNAYRTNPAGGGSGGAIRLVANTISGTGTVTAVGFPENLQQNAGSLGRVRLEAYTISSALSFTDRATGLVTPVGESTPTIPLFVPKTPQSSVRVTSINGTAITENPFRFPDIPINTDHPVPVVITGHQVPVGTVPTLIILGETGDQDLQCVGGLQGTLATSSCTINIKFNYGGSRGLVKATWKNSGSQ